MNNQYFAFEADFVGSLRCIPMIVRFNLDLCGIKLSLRAWSRFDLATREQLASMPARLCDEIAGYRSHVRRAIENIGEQPSQFEVDRHPLWAIKNEIPEVIRRKSRELDIVLDDISGWQRLSSLQRFALIKLTRGGHENNNFVPALREFGLIS